jgi:myo-inositol-1(or 4)-monophosphatase
LTASILEVARTAAQSAGACLRNAWGRVKVLKAKDGIRDLLTQADLDAEQALIAVIRAAFPDHHILAEESGEVFSQTPSSYCWILDPLDGTTNFVHQVPYCCVSVACTKADQLAAAVVYAPFQEELFAAELGGGATLNGAPIQVSRIDRLEESLLTTGFPSSPGIPLEPHLEVFARLLRKAQGVRRPGAAALNLAYVACGRFDAFWGADLKPWDIAAGMLLVQEAGGLVNGYQSERDQRFPSQLIASNGHLHELLNQILNAA